jgi:predicted PurR-regulated permease PerM
MQRGELQMFAKKVAIITATVLTLLLLWAVREIVFLIFIAAALAAGIAPVVKWVRVRWRYQFRRNLRRGPAVMIVYLPFLISVLLLLILVVPRVIHEAQGLSKQLPALVEANVLKPLEGYVPVNLIREQLAAGVEVPRARVFGYVRTSATVFAAIVAVLFMVMYMLIDAERLRNMFLLVYPPESRADRRRTLNRMASRMSSWLSGQLVLSAIIGVSTCVFLFAIGVPYALPLAIIAAIGELVPMLGPTLGTLPALAIALLHSKWHFWAVLIFAVVLQKVENVLIVPRVMSKKISVSPLAVFVAFMCGASLLGVVGAIMAIPAAAILQVTFDEAFVRRRERRQDVERAGTLLRRVD